MIIILFSFIASTFYVVKYGVGKEKLFFLYPLGLYLLGDIVFGIVVALNPSFKESGAFIMGIPLTIGTVVTCFWIVAKVRKNGMNRVLAAMNDGTFQAPVKKFEL